MKVFFDRPLPDQILEALHGVFTNRFQPWSPFSVDNGGETGIRTLGTREGSTVFETAPIDHSGTSPCVKCLDISNLARKRYVIVIAGLFVRG